MQQQYFLQTLSDYQIHEQLCTPYSTHLCFYGRFNWNSKSWTYCNYHLEAANQSLFLKWAVRPKCFYLLKLLVHHSPLSNGVSLRLSLCGVYSFPASGSFLMPTHHHLLHANKLGVLGGAGRDLKKKNERGRVWGREGCWKQKKLEWQEGKRKRDLPLSLFCALLNLSSLSLPFILRLRHPNKV